MKKTLLYLRSGSVLTLIAFGALFSCQVDEDPSEETDLILENTAVNEQLLTGKANHCTKGAINSVRNVDITNPVNAGKNDDRTCYSNYFESKVGNTIYGNYHIRENSNQFETRLQPRIERSFPRANNNRGSYVQFKGTVRILETGKTGNAKDDGTYIAQAKGKHTGGGGSPDPAICLFLAKPVMGVDAQGRTTQVSFDIYREQIITRGGSGLSGRRVVKLTNIRKGVPTAFELKVGFRTVDGQKIHYANAKINGKNYYWNIPEPNRGRESGIRYGAYRIKGGTARIQWANTTFKRVNR